MTTKKSDPGGFLEKDEGRSVCKAIKRALGIGLMEERAAERAPTSPYYNITPHSPAPQVIAPGVSPWFTCFLDFGFSF